MITYSRHTKFMVATFSEQTGGSVQLTDSKGSVCFNQKDAQSVYDELGEALGWLRDKVEKKEEW